MTNRRAARVEGVEIFALAAVFDWVLSVWVGVVLAVPVLVRITDLLCRLRSRRRSVASWPVAPASLTLLVRVDSDSGLLRPSVQIHGGSFRFPARLRLELVDDNAVVRYSSTRRLAVRTTGTELALAAFPPPDGSTIDEVLGWHWDVVIEEGRSEKARWREHPAPAGALNAEAEIEMPGLAPFPRG